LGFLCQFVGCSDGSGAAGGGGTAPDEVKKYEDRKKAEREGRDNAPK
jgi:hypothetical protein